MTARRPGPDNTARLFDEQTTHDGARVMVDAPLDAVLEAVGQQLRWSLWTDGVDNYEALAMRTLARLVLDLRRLSPTPHPAQPQEPSQLGA